MKQIFDGKEGFEEIYLKHFPRLLVYGKTITRDELLIEDTIQEMFLSLWQKKDSLFIQSSLESYFLVAFRNNLIRKLKIQRKTNNTMDFTEQEPLEFITSQEVRLKFLIQKLPPRQREVLYLRYYNDYSYQEIAEQLGISYQVARNFSYRAIKTLKEKMTNLPSLL
ncbi:MAG: sigma-70 family RNA polymerase sigma factor [Saprospiraceae bacterium]|nr:sigma-70 family RNA polymerase sigma factor [Saprospiraceae bacterium]